ncbi:hypothetical protein CUN59_15560 [Cuspidothrix issatschenkoi CHARLIE-1]|uniref:Uncharacterized protein n=1 Tax=Cuspidothrix issatschenkoi CHARLIE-1 TaxID=2052836 RepID=A0A2S6CRU0_9CYAN|nr:hypothetical protein CUN59_15560 [Cuspidothrix issatschenkoi CHARLIE-1]
MDIFKDSLQNSVQFFILLIAKIHLFRLYLKISGWLYAKIATSIQNTRQAILAKTAAPVFRVQVFSYTPIKLDSVHSRKNGKFIKKRNTTKLVNKRLKKNCR